VKKSRAELTKEKRINPEPANITSSSSGQRMPVMPWLPPGRPITHGMKSGCFYALKLPRRRRPEQRNVNFWKNKASARGKSTLPTQRILDLKK